MELGYLREIDNMIGDVLGKNQVCRKLSKLVNKITKNRYFIVLNTLFTATFFLLLFDGHYTNNIQLLYLLNFLKYLIILSISLCIYEYYRTESKIVFSILLVALILVWFSGYDFAYRWDAIQHVARTKYYMEHDFFNSSERTSLVYIIWGFVYGVFGESEKVTNLTNMIFGLIGIFGIYKISVQLYDKFTSALSALLSFTFPVFFLVNKWAYLDIMLVTFVIITIFFILKYVNTGRDSYLYFSIVFAFLTTSINLSGLTVFPIILLCLLLYKRLMVKNLPFLTLGILFSLIYVYFVSLSFESYKNITETQNDMAIISPYNFGLDSIFLWLGLLNQQLQQFLYSGIFIIAIFFFIKFNKKNSLAIYAILISQIVLFIIDYNFLKFEYYYYFPLFPLHNYLPQLFLFGTLVLFLIFYNTFNKIEYEFGKNELFLCMWIIFFMIFFIINGKVYGLGTKSSIDASFLDFRYLMPAFPALIILFSANISKLLKSDLNHLKYISILIVSIIVVFNYIIATNLVFYYESSGDAYLQGYEKTRNFGPTSIYSQWPFYYSPKGEIYDLGDFKWKSDNVEIYDIFSYNWSKNSYLLFSNQFYNAENLINFEIIEVEPETYNLNPLLYKITEETAHSVYIAKTQNNSIMLKNGFYGLENWDNIQTRWVSNNANISFYSDEDKDFILSFNVSCFYKPRNLYVYLNDELIRKENITNFVKIEIPINPRNGENTVRFYIPDGCQRPMDIYGLKNKDSRCLSLAFRNITINELR